MDILVDTNVLIRLANERDSNSAPAISAYSKLLERGHRLFITPQNLIEFWVVCTRPLRVNGMGLTAGNAEKLLRATELGFFTLQDSERVYRKWRDLILRYAVSGRQAHDAHLVASMLVHGVTHILTFNGRDFARYSEIEVIDPMAVE